MRAWPFVAALALGLAVGCKPGPKEHSSTRTHVESTSDDRAPTRSTYSSFTPSRVDRSSTASNYAGLASYGGETPMVGRFSFGLTSRTALMMSIAGALVGGFGFSFLVAGMDLSPVHFLTGGGTAGWVMALAGLVTFSFRRADSAAEQPPEKHRRSTPDPDMPAPMPEPMPAPAPT